MFGAPALHEPMDAVVRAIVSSAAKLLKKPDRRATLAPRQSVFCLKDGGQSLDPQPQFALRPFCRLRIGTELASGAPEGF